VWSCNSSEHIFAAFCRQDTIARFRRINGKKSDDGHTLSYHRWLESIHQYTLHLNVNRDIWKENRRTIPPRSWYLRILFTAKQPRPYSARLISSSFDYMLVSDTDVTLKSRTAESPRWMSEFWQKCSPSGRINLVCFDLGWPATSRHSTDAQSVQWPQNNIRLRLRTCTSLSHSHTVGSHSQPILRHLQFPSTVQVCVDFLFGILLQRHPLQRCLPRCAFSR
jgi:hypothetical protein